MTHGSKELDEDAAKLAAMGADPGPEFRRVKADAMIVVCEEIMVIMETYREQEKSHWGVGTPGGLEHMGDVWRKFRKWDELLRKDDVPRKGAKNETHPGQRG